MLAETWGLWAVVSLPAGVFHPYSGVKTSILFLDKVLAKKTDKVLFVKVQKDGFDLGAQRRPIGKNDLPAASEDLRAWQNGEKRESPLANWVSKAKIAKAGDYNLTGDRYKEVVKVNAKWPMVELGEVIETLAPPKKLQQSDYQSTGRYPIVDQSQREISGWPNDEGAAISAKYPLVVFGDHTCAAKYVERPLIQGADGIKIPQTSKKLHPKYLYFILKYRPIESDGYKRHFSKLKETHIPLSPFDVQRQIVAELDGYQRVIDGARQVIASWKPVVPIDPSWPM
jgi:type I restriction enzyme M protein